MATLQDYYGKTQRSLSKDIETYDLQNFVETGTGYGDSVSYALENGFGVKSVYSIEINEQIASKARNRFIGYKNLSIVTNDSYNGLAQIVPKLIGNTVFFLDAHFPGADFGYAEYRSESNSDLNLPLQNELELIHSLKDVSKDLFLIDDLRIYEVGDYEMGNWPKEKGAVHSGIDFITKIFEKTHTIEKHYFYSGFLTIFPKTL